MSGRTIGEYLIVILGDAGEVVAEIECTTQAQVPLPGHEIVVDDNVHVVERVRHEIESDSPLRRKRTVPTVFVRRDDRGGKKAPTDDKTDSTQSTARVIPLALHRRHLGPAASCAILPGWLVAMIVHSGYLDQRVEYRSRRRIAARLIREGARWYLDRGADPSELWALSRQAKRYFEEMDGLLREFAAGGVPVAIADERQTHDVSPGLPAPPLQSPAQETPSFGVLLPMKRLG